jgi:uncharacterized protein YdhG (YjbR/CyaY superfamily)
MARWLSAASCPPSDAPPREAAAHCRMTGHGICLLDRTRMSGIVANVRMESMSAAEIDAYLQALDEPKRRTLTQLRETILDILPDADQGISYGAPAFKVSGKTIAGFAAFKHHLSYLPHSGSVLVELSEELKGYATSSGALRFDIDKPLPRHLLKKLIDVRLRQASAS